jgi:hypothetical protein
MDSGNLSTLIGALCGFGASITPEIVGVIKDSKQHEYTMEEKRLELEAAKENYTFQVQLNTLTTNTDELKALLAHDAALKGNAFIEFLRASVRPVVTYIFMGMFCIVKLTFLYTMLTHDIKFTEAVPLLWDTDSMSIFAAVLSFWFGSRALDQYRTNTPRSLNTQTSSIPPSTARKRQARRL